MKLVTFSSQGFKRIGAIYPNNVIVDLNYAYQALLESEGKLRSEQIAEAYVPATMEAFLQGGNESLSIAKNLLTTLLTIVIPSGINWFMKLKISSLKLLSKSQAKLFVSDITTVSTLLKWVVNCRHSLWYSQSSPIQ